MKIKTVWDEDNSWCKAKLLRNWENGCWESHPATPSVRLPSYRKKIVEIFNTWSPSKDLSVLSIGCGNGFTEKDLSDSGYKVLATDKWEEALNCSREKGLTTARLDIMDIPVDFPEHPIVYADGVMGIFWDTKRGFADFFKALIRLTSKEAVIILCNELADTDSSPDLRVTADATLQLYRPTKGAVAAMFEDTYHPFRKVHSELFTYSRPGRINRRRRELLVLQRTIISSKTAKT